MSDLPNAPVRFQLENDSIVFDVIDGETVIMNLDRGTYYALNASAGRLWQMIIRRLGQEEIIQNLNDQGIQFDCKELGNFVQKLVNLNLIVPDGNGVLYDGMPTAEISFVGWDKPEITEYSDMKDLLAMDPPLPVTHRGK